MPDISMCDNKRCSKKKECYRFMAIPSSFQSFMKFEETIKNGKKSCDGFYPIGGRKVRKK